MTEPLTPGPRASTVEGSEELELVAGEELAIEPKTPTERILYLAVILGVAAIVTIGIGGAWAVKAVMGTADDFPQELQIAFFSALSFLFGGGLAARPMS